MEAQNIEDIYTLSPTQQGMLFHILSALDSRMYVEQTVCTLHATLNISAFEQVWQQVIDRHQSLRTAFVWQGLNQPVQIVHQQAKLAIAHYDWRDLSTTQQEAQLQSYLEADQKSGFDLAQPPLMRLALIQTEVDTYQFIWSICHLVLDAWCVNTILKEFLSCYEALCQGRILQLQPSRPYRDYISWLKQQDLSEAEVFWRKYLQGFTTPTSLTADWKSQQEGFNQQQVQLSLTTTEALKSLAQQHHLTLNTLVQGVWALLLSYYSNEADVVYGTVVSGRPPTLLGVSSMVGLFINTLPVRVLVSGEVSLLSWLKELHSQQLSIRRYECTPLVQIQNWSQVPPGIPLFKSILVFENSSANISSLPTGNLRIDNVRSFINSNYPLVLLVKPWSQLSLNIFYDLRYFNTMTVTRMLSHLSALLNNIVANSDTTLRTLTHSIVDIERQQLLVEFNNTRRDYVNDKCIHQLIESQAERTPENVAVVFKNEQLTYRELNTRANQLAHRLQALGVEPDVLVGICVERSWEMLVGILGILKAGGAYVPIDPMYPNQRLSYMLEDSQVSIILTQERLVKNLPDIGAQVLCLDALWDAIAQEGDENLKSEVKTHNLAYLIYTSGSTGQPKGVQVTHQNLVHSTTARICYYEQPVTGFLLTSPFAFDSSVAVIFWTLCQGGFVSILPENGQLDIQQIIEVMPTAASYAQQQISHLLCLPSLYKLILEQAQPQQLLSLKTVIVAGESCPKELVKQHRELFPKTHLFNEYGPTEATVWSSVYDCQNHDLNNSVPIGRPIANTQIYLLDSQLQPVPIGVSGEIYISGFGLAKGYLNRPELTAQKFIPNPFSNEPNARLYKTGDLGRYLPDGNIEFLGRLDQQVKIRGYRIELAEIEAVLNQHSAVQEAIAIAQEDIDAHRRLIAYIVPKKEQVPTVDDLRSFLKNSLPEYMLPSVFVMLKALPLNPNGKVDRQALPIPDQERPNLEAVFVAPSTAIEVALAEIWSQVLGVEQVGIHDNFFKLGGHSLLVTKLVLRVRETFQVELPLRSLFEMPTVASLAKNLEIAQKTGASTIGTKTVADLQTEAVLDPTIRPEVIAIECTTEPDHIFLTGATGFLGAFLLYELLQQTQADIYCLVRSPNAEEGKKRIQSSLESYLLWDESLSPRIISVVGDLSQPLLGLSEEQFRAMAELLDVIYHNGAWVHHTSPYSVLKAANVLGTQEVLRLASQTKVKPVHFISTISVFSSVGHSGVKVVREQDSLDDYQVPGGGYSQSKWVAEKLVTIGRERGIPACIYRLGRVSGHSQTGVSNINDFLYRLIIGCIQLGCMPEVEMIENMAPVDYISRAIVHLSRQQESLGKAFHLVNPQSFNSSMLSNLICSSGYSLKQIPYDQWQLELLRIAQREPEHALYPLVPLLLTKESQEKIPNSTVLQFDCQNTLNGFVDTSIVCPPVDEQLLRTYFSSLILSGFFEAQQLSNKSESSSKKTLRFTSKQST